jgi:hypothetical protein
LINIQINKVKELTDTENKGHMVSLGARKPETRNTLRITETHSAVTAELAALEKATAAQVDVAYFPFRVLPEDHHELGSRLLYVVA